MKVYLVELTAANASGALSVFRFGTGGYATRPSDNPANAFFEPRMEKVPQVLRSMYREGQTSGAGQIGFGVLDLVNPDGGLDHLLEYGFDGWPCRIWCGEDSQPFSTFTLCLEGAAEQPVLDETHVRIHLRDASQALDVPVQDTRYAGDNVLPDGVEGVESDIKGQPKPVLFGHVLNMAPVCVNTAMLVYQVNDGPVETITVYDRRSPLVLAGDVPDVAALMAATGIAGEYTTCLAEGLFRLHGLPVGQVTADVEQADETLAEVITALASRAGVAVSSADAAALGVALPGPVGYLVDREITVAAALAEVTGGIGAYAVPDATGVLRMGLLTAPSGPAVAEIVESQVLGIRRMVPRDTDRGIPAREVVVSYARCWHTMTRDQLAAIAEADIALVGQQYRKAVASDSTVLDQYPLASVIERTTVLAEAADAEATAARLQALYGVRRDMYELTIADAPALDLGDVVDLVHPRYGLVNGKLFRVLSIETQEQPDRLRLIVWG